LINLIVNFRRPILNTTRPDQGVETTATLKSLLTDPDPSIFYFHKAVNSHINRLDETADLYTTSIPKDGSNI